MTSRAVGTRSISSNDTVTISFEVKFACTGMYHRMHFLDPQQLDRWRNG